MRDDAVLGHALPLDRGLGPTVYTSVVLSWNDVVSAVTIEMTITTRFMTLSQMA